MTGRGWHRCRALTATVLAVGLPACESPTPPASTPPLPPPPPSLDVGDARATAECGGVSIRAEPPRRLDPVSPFDVCEPTFMVAVSVEAENEETMVADFLRDYHIAAWRVGTNDGRFRHDVTIAWYPELRSLRSSLPHAQPLTVRACPEGEGPVLACYESSCEVVASEDQVKPFLPSWIGLELAVPWGYSTIHELRDGETLSIPVSYTAHTDMMASVAIESFSSSLRLLEPKDQDLGTLRAGDSGSVIFRVMGDLGGRQEYDEGLPWVWFSSDTDGGTDGRCTMRPNSLRIRVLPSP